MNRVPFLEQSSLKTNPLIIHTPTASWSALAFSNREFSDEQSSFPRTEFPSDQSTNNTHPDCVVVSTCFCEQRILRWTEFFWQRWIENPQMNRVPTWIWILSTFSTCDLFPQTLHFSYIFLQFSFQNRPGPGAWYTLQYGCTWQKKKIWSWPARAPNWSFLFVSPAIADYARQQTEMFVDSHDH